jgi:predicted CoA-binding protein
MMERRPNVDSATVQTADVLTKYRVIAVVGASKNEEKDAFTVPQYMKKHGYTIIPVNPTTDSVMGERCYRSLAEIPTDLAKSVDIVNVFRPSEELPGVAQQAAEMKKKTGRPLVFWAQLGLENEEAKKILRGAGIEYVMNSCMRVEHRLMGGSR